MKRRLIREVKAEWEETLAHLHALENEMKEIRKARGYKKKENYGHYHETGRDREYTPSGGMGTRY